MKIRLNVVLFFFMLVSFVESTHAQELSKDGLPSLKGKKVLVVYGGWKRHYPLEFMQKVTPWLEAQGAQVIVSDSLGIYAQEEIMKDIDLILQSWTMGTISKAQINGLTKAVKRGVGLAGCHGGIGDSFRNNQKFQYMVGGQWVAHPGNKLTYQVDIIDTEDPITKGIDDFSVESEQYYLLVDPNSQVLATTTYTGEYDYWVDGAVMPVMWKRHYGKGRIFYLSVGHSPEDWEHPDVWTLLTRGFRWASGGKSQPLEDTMSPVYPGK
ncbi:MAG: ThuA domain-containing protein [Bacteroidota bacterium]